MNLSRVIISTQDWCFRKIPRDNVPLSFFYYDVSRIVNHGFANVVKKTAEVTMIIGQIFLRETIDVIRLSRNDTNKLFITFSRYIAEYGESTMDEITVAFLLKKSES